MLGWHVSIYRQAEDGTSPAQPDSPQGARLAVWQTGVDGLAWIDQLVERGEAIDLGGGGYPSRYTATAGRLVPLIIGGAERAQDPWVSGSQDVLTPQWEGKTVIDRAAAEACPQDEWLLVEAWDES